MVIAEEESTGAKDSHDIDLKCAEKVTDSDNEDNVEAGESKACKSESITITVTGTTTTTTSAPSQAETTAASNDITCKPKPIKAQRQPIDSPLLKYQQVYLNAYSPKNPTGILPFQPTGESIMCCNDTVSEYTQFSSSFIFQFISLCTKNLQVVLLKRCQLVQKM